jgi:riboflavin kinase/FMN adenylyltransferase
MKFKTTTVSGHGRGKDLGYPTVNMIIPESVPLFLRPGIYAAKAIVKGEKYYGALFYGPTPTFNETDMSLEIYLFDTLNFYVGEDEEIEIETFKYIREVKKFDLPELLIHQMDEDVIHIRKVFNI